MKVYVVYESLWGNTAAIARAIAEGLGIEAQALTTGQATAAVIQGAGMIIAGAPVHTLNLPTRQSREAALTERMGPDGAPPNLNDPPLRSWLAGLPPAQGLSAAFDTRVRAWYGRGAAPRILRSLKQTGYRPLARPVGFFVSGHPIRPSTDGVLCDGELDRAMAWGKMLARMIEGRP